jgi:hypothetical protein
MFDLLTFVDTQELVKKGHYDQALPQQQQLAITYPTNNDLQNLILKCQGQQAQASLPASTQYILNNNYNKPSPSSTFETPSVAPKATPKTNNQILAEEDLSANHEHWYHRPHVAAAEARPTSNQEVKSGSRHFKTTYGPAAVLSIHEMKRSRRYFGLHTINIKNLGMFQVIWILAGIVLTIVGVAIEAQNASVWYAYAQLPKNGIVTPGTVVGVAKYRHIFLPGVYSYDISYQYEANGLHEHSASIDEGLYLQVSRGSQIAVMYSPDNSYVAQIVGNNDEPSSAATTAFMCLIFPGFGIIVLVTAILELNFAALLAPIAKMRRKILKR